MPEDKLRGMPIPDECNALNQLTVFGKIFPKPPYNCLSRKQNPELEALLELTYREEYEILECDDCKHKSKFYMRDVHNDPDEDYDVVREVLCEKDWLKLPIFPKEDVETLNTRIMVAKKKEKAAGIIHYDMLLEYGPMSEMMESIPVKKLQLNFPFPRVTNNDQLERLAKEENELTSEPLKVGEYKITLTGDSVQDD